MIDWLTVVVPFKHRPLSSGRLLKLSPDGSLEWETVTRYQHAGSYSTTIVLRSQGYLDSDGNAQYLYIDGNLTKLLQGHNVTGTDDLIGIVCNAFRYLCVALDLPFTPFDLMRLSFGDFEVKRVDVTYSFRVGNDDLQVNNFLSAVADCGSTKYRRANTNRGTVYFNHGSRRWTCAMYNKAAEVSKRSPIPSDVRSATIDSWRYAYSPSCKQSIYTSELWQHIIDQVKGCIRIEFRFRSLELAENGLLVGSAWDAGTARELWCKYMNRIEFSGNVRLTGEQLHELPTSVRSTYELWRSGVVVRDLVSRATFYRHKRILKEYGIDIDERPAQTAQVIPLVRYIEAEPVQFDLPSVTEGLLRAV
jgi:II/X family phage/plasmid replication protein